MQASYPFSMWKRLAKATPELRQNFYLSYAGIHWPDIDEDLSFEGMFANAGLCERTPTEDAVYYETEYVRKAGEDEERSQGGGEDEGKCAGKDKMKRRAFCSPF